MSGSRQDVWHDTMRTRYDIMFGNHGLVFTRELEVDMATRYVLVFSAFFAASSPLTSFALLSRSSSLSPRLNGSLSATGDGSTVDSGCHLLDLLAVLRAPALVFALLLAVPLALLALLLVLAENESWISSGGPSWKDTLRRSGEAEALLLLNRSGLACGRGGRGGGTIITLLAYSYTTIMEYNA